MTISNKTALVNYDTGTVWVQGLLEKEFTIDLALADEYRRGATRQYPVELFCGQWVVRFPFGLYYLTKHLGEFSGSVIDTRSFAIFAVKSVFNVRRVWKMYSYEHNTQVRGEGGCIGDVLKGKSIHDNDGYTWYKVPLMTLDFKTGDKHMAVGGMTQMIASSFVAFSTGGVVEVQKYQLSESTGGPTPSASATREIIPRMLLTEAVPIINPLDYCA